MEQQTKYKRYPISICLATYNGAAHLKKQIDTILPQLDEADEIVISDDHSTDHTLEVLRSFHDERIKIFNNGKKKGPVGNFENSLQKANGEVIFLCDQDDIWFSDKIEKHMEMHKEYDLVVSDAIVTDEFNAVLFDSFFKERKSGKGILPNLIRNSYIGCCMSFKKELLKSALPFPNQIHMHDWWIGLVAEIKGRIYFLNEPLMYYIRHTENASNTLVKTLPLAEQFKNRLVLLTNLIKLRFFKKWR
ncbi:glycosyltransferase family 2 protein [Pedobacter metabolipauper]|uniref:Glycosyltransferase involved in cell wall biosynthesis n=1 Tax=Pedobacter metabolipauper TaxID=425513 RepID=A0A4R6SVY1_9SPHI|nr:glycosyltransferase family 2 protein [Pedobacter metabolipauper]TDQ09970.1 glycosyltransferase involved in cell wall biosynthesis [Pedobacter metabolipauper]